MYYAIVAALMFVLPVLSIAIDASGDAGRSYALLAGRWFVFWSVGVRLVLAGLRQIVQPRYTAQTILGISGDEALIVVRELGFANLAIGTIALGSIFATGWVTAGALAGGIFYGLAGLNHVRQDHRGRLENVAMTSDLFAAVVLLCYCLSVALSL